MAAEFMQQHVEPPLDGFARMGQPIGSAPRAAAYEHAKQMGITDRARAWEVVNTVAEQLARDKPYEAMAAGMKFLDLTGTYRLMAVLLTTPEVD